MRRWRAGPGAHPRLGQRSRATAHGTDECTRRGVASTVVTTRGFTVAALVLILTALGLIVAALRSGDLSAPAISRRRIRLMLPALLLFVAAALMFAAASQ
jgi:hypothetical protein